MTMNASGPLSFGGPTLGQSINRELLQPSPYSQALSFASSTYRALAQVPTGSISLASVYGKTYTRYGTAAASFTRSTGIVAMSITSGQPGAQFYLYLYYTGSGQPYPGYLAPDYPATNVIGTLDSNGNWSKTYNVSGDAYWYYGAWYNNIYVYQGATGQSLPNDPFTAPGGPLGTRIGDFALYTG